MTRIQNADDLGKERSSVGQWLVMTVMALAVSVGVIFLVSVAGFILYDFMILALPVVIVLGIIGLIAYGILKITHHDFRKARHS